MKRFVLITGLVLAFLVGCFTALAWFAIGKAEEAVNKMRTNAALKQRWARKNEEPEPEEEEEEEEREPEGAKSISLNGKEVTNG